MRTHYVSATVPNILYGLSHLILTATLWSCINISKKKLRLGEIKIFVHDHTLSKEASVPSLSVMSNSLQPHGL